jgi:peptide/nickel transport system substrate-binding protein
MQRIVERRLLQSGPLQFLLGVALVTACSDSNRSPQSAGGGTIVIAVSGDPKTLFPPLATTGPARQIDEQVYDYLLVVGPDLNTFDDGKFQPRLAESWKWSPDSLSIAFRINSKARWHDGIPANASDVQFTYQVYSNPELASPFAEDLANIDSVTVPDSMTAVFWYHSRTAHQLLDASQPMIIPRHIFEKTPIKSLEEFGATTTPIGTGRFRFKSATLGSSVELVADTGNYRGKPGVDRVIWSIATPSSPAAARLFGGEADVYAALRPDHLADLAKHPEIRLTTFPGTEHTFIRFNLKRPLFAPRDMRRALTMAVDRPSIVRNAFDTLALPSIGPTVRVFPTTDAASLRQIPFDPLKARAVLDSLGWKIDLQSRIRAKNGRALEFTLIVPSTSVPRNNMAVVVQEQLRQIGVRMKIEKMEFATFNDRLGSRDYDAAFDNMIYGATPNGVREWWGSESTRQKGGRNSGGYENPRFDAEIDSAIASRRLSDSRRHFTNAYQTIIDDAPALWMSEQKIVMGVHRRIKTTTMRADSWWYTLADWTIPASEQIARDHVSSAH